MIEMTLSSRHRIRNSNPGGLRPSTLPLGHKGTILTAETGNRTPNSGVKGSGANHYPRSPALDMTGQVIFLVLGVVTSVYWVQF